MGVRALTRGGAGPSSRVVVVPPDSEGEDAPATTDAETTEAPTLTNETETEITEITEIDETSRPPATPPPPLYEAYRVGGVYDQLATTTPAPTPTRPVDDVFAAEEVTETTEDVVGPYGGVGAFGDGLGYGGLGYGGLEDEDD